MNSATAEIVNKKQTRANERRLKPIIKTRMNYKLPITITNGAGEVLTFERFEDTPDGERLTGKAVVQPGRGPIMHVHYRQDEGMSIVSGIMGYQILGQGPAFAYPGESVVFPKGVAHRFWAEGSEVLHTKAWISPPNDIIFFLSSVFAAQKKSGTDRPEIFDAAYLLTRYKSEYSILELPFIVRKVVMPVAYTLGRIFGKYKHFKNAPSPLP